MMPRVILRDSGRMSPCSEPACDLRVPHWELHIHRSHLPDAVRAPDHVADVLEVDSLTDMDSRRTEALAFPDDRFGNKPFLDEFGRRA